MTDPKPSDLVLHTPDHPEANGKQPTAGNLSYRLEFPLDDGRLLVVYMGQVGWDAVVGLVHKVESGAPSDVT